MMSPFYHFFFSYATTLNKILALPVKQLFFMVINGAFCCFQATHRTNIDRYTV